MGGPGTDELPVTGTDENGNPVRGTRQIDVGDDAAGGDEPK